MNTPQDRGSHASGDAHPRHTKERRRQRRRPTRLPGWIYFTDQIGRDHVIEVEMVDRSEDGGAGFISQVELDPDSAAHLKIGLGPMRHPRPGRICRCAPLVDGRFRLGFVFDASPIKWVDPGDLEQAA